MNVHRLQVLSQFLRTVPREQFNYTEWVTTLNRNWLWQPVACGTVACALGWACLIPEFLAAGLGISRKEPVFSVFAGLAAGGVFFDLTKEQASHLFLETEEGEWCREDAWEITPIMIANRIDRLIAKYEQKPVVKLVEAA